MIINWFLHGGKGFDNPLAFIGDVLGTDDAGGFLGETFDDVEVVFEDATALPGGPLCVVVVEGPGLTGEPFAWFSIFMTKKNYKNALKIEEIEQLNRATFHFTVTLGFLIHKNQNQ